MQMRKWILLTTAAAAAISVSAATAQTSDQRRDTPNATQESPRATDQNSRRDRNDSRQATPSAQSREQNATSQNTPSTITDRDSKAAPDKTERNNKAEGSRGESNKTGQNSPANSQHGQQRESEDANHNGAPATQRSTQNPPDNRPSSAQTSPATQSNQRSGATAQPSQNRATEGRAPALTKDQQSRFASAISRHKVEPVTRVDFSIKVGVNVPSHVHLSPVPSEIVEIVPQYRGYSYFVTADRIVIVEPRTHHIVYVMPYEGRGRTATSSATARHSSLSLTDEQRQVIRKNARPARRTTTGSSVRREVTIEEEVPSSIELETFDEPVVREVPAMREYRYYRNDEDVVIVDPSGRRVLDVVR
jgi:hypothetical protein